MSYADDRLKAALAAIANAGLDALPPAQLGEVELRDDQRRIVARARRALDRDGGCLIAEAVGRGKTYVALALARRWQHPLAVVPASLRSTWLSACTRAGVICAIISHESLSRGSLPSTVFDGIIVDESHHFRTPTTRRYDALTNLAARAPLVLLSATPLQNRTRDLAAQLALYLGEMAFAIDPAALSRFVIRGDDSDAVEGMPIVSAPEWVKLDADDGEVLRAILALAAPAKPLDGGDAGALRTISLVRAWASSRAALEATLRTRRRLAAAVEQGVEAGRAPTRREIRAWHAAEGVVQLGFASLLMDGTPSAAALTDLRLAIERERDTLGDLARVLRETADPDVARVDALRSIRAKHAGARIIAFSEFASTVTSFYSAMRADAGVGMLTAREARIATGRIARDELLTRFAPVAQFSRPRAAHESVTLLLATDLLSEGVNLQDASVVVHLDLPWNPARLAQRVGRLRRPGGAREVRAYLLASPARAAMLLDADARLRRKLATAERVIGRGIGVLPALTRDSASLFVSTRPDHTSATDEGTLIALLERWRSDSPLHIDETTCIVAGVASHANAWLVALEDGRIISSVEGCVSDSSSSALRVALQLEGQPRIADEEETRGLLAQLERWLAAEELATTCGLDLSTGPYRRTVLHWLETLTRNLPRHERATALPLIGRLHSVLQTSFQLGTERQLAAIAARRRDSAAESLQEALEVVEHSTRERRAITQVGARVVAIVIAGSR
ncbi:MAG: hypothetical protein JWL61_375 [Gemmatimonadetes bacterium]|nr:hypothetical protein [Gemmatimonadota bacterium]